MTAARHVDLAMSTLLALQGFTLFVAIPLASSHPSARILIDLCHLGFAAICVVLLTRHRLIQAVLLAAFGILAVGPHLADAVVSRLDLAASLAPSAIAVVAFTFNVLVTALVFRELYGPGRVTAHRVRGAVLLYLNVAALFAILYGIIDMLAPGAIVHAGSAVSIGSSGQRIADMTYFSIVTITTTGYGDLLPGDPPTRSLAGLEAVFGQLFPATLLARLVALNLTHIQQNDGGRASAVANETEIFR